jgi:RNA polymerase sigma-70 factor (ECF subfamily)
MEPTSSLSTSSSLVRRVQAGDEEAWTRFARLYTPLAFGWCRQAGLQNADIADVVQNVFTSVHRGIGKFRRTQATDTLRGWLWTIARNEIRGHYRRKAGRAEAAGGTEARLSIEQLPAIIDGDSAPSDPAAERHFVHRALRMIESEFEPTTWRAFWRTTVDGQAAPDVAAELGLSPGAVRQAKHRVLIRLREFLAEE